MILVDTGPLKALFDPKDQHHVRCEAILQKIQEGLVTTVPVLVEAFHLLRGRHEITSTCCRAIVVSSGKDE